MPFPLLAHQAPVLALKAWRPAAFNGTALVVGSLAPDFDYLWNTRPGAQGFGHTLVGQLSFCLPLTMSAVLLIGHLRLGEVLAARMGKRVAWLVDAATDVTRAGGVWRAVVSALCGSFSHLAFDRLTHQILPVWMPRAHYHVGRITFTMHAVVQVGASVIGALVALWLLWRLSLPNAPTPPTHRPGALWLVPFALIGAAAGGVRSLPAVHHPDWYFEAGVVYVWGYAVFFVLSGAAVGTLVAATGLAWWDRRTKTR